MLSACASTPRLQAADPQSPPENAVGIAAGLFAADADKARALLAQGAYELAAVEFRKLMDFGDTEDVRAAARLDMARCLIKMQNYDGAIAMLQPFPTEPRSDNERRGLAIAGEALLRDDRSEEAETLLEIALGSYEPGDEVCQAWAAGCCANLGLAYLKNSKYAQAAALYRRAAALYRQCDLFADEREANEMAETIEALIYHPAQGESP
jgi:tetratricopeptide (TPR) repeat protein